MNLGFLGGSFDPIHFGHLCIAQDALENLALDKVVFVPAACSPHKEVGGRASDTQRLNMLRLALAEYPRFEVSEVDLLRGGVSYTWETVRLLRQNYPSDRLFWILGADQLQRLHLWSRAEELVRHIEFICMERPGHELRPPASLPGLRWHVCPGHHFQISSSEIRERLSRGDSVSCFVPHKAVEYIHQNHLYT